MRMLAVCVLVAVLAGCGGQKPVSYREQIQPILDKHCGQCHSEQVHRRKIVLASYETIMTSKAAITGGQPLVTPGDPTASRLYVLCATAQAKFRMPPDTSSLTALTKDELELLVRWINQGAKNN